MTLVVVVVVVAAVLTGDKRRPSRCTVVLVLRSFLSVLAGVWVLLRSSMYQDSSSSVRAARPRDKSREGVF